MTYGLRLFAVAVAGLILRGAAAQLPPAVPSGAYVLGADDVIEITDQNHPELNQTLTMLPDGSITYPSLGTLRAAGRTPADLAQEIRRLLERSRNNVDVTVGVKEVHSKRVRVLGAVKTSGPFDLKANWRVLDVISVAGGLTGRPAHIKARIIRGGEAISLDIEDGSAHPDGGNNPLVQPDDLILLDENDPTQNKVFVMGQVNKPGAYDLGDQGIGLVSLLSQAGNPTDAAALTQAYILRGKTEIPINLRPIVVEGKVDEATRALQLQAGDVLFVPGIERRIAVMGQVNKPGYYPIPEMRTITALDALSLAGGQTQTGELAKAGIIRTVDGAAKVVPVDIEKMLKKGDVASNLVLQPNDILFIPSRGERKFSWEAVLGPLSTLSYLGLHL
jgi:protein involved in polysaccharide export with SLBB domain